MCIGQCVDLLFCCYGPVSVHLWDRKSDFASVYYINNKSITFRFFEIGSVYLNFTLYTTSDELRLQLICCSFFLHCCTETVELYRTMSYNFIYDFTIANLMKFSPIWNRKKNIGECVDDSNIFFRPTHIRSPFWLIQFSNQLKIEHIFVENGMLHCQCFDRFAC